jgi:Tol biopolymer transport system component
MKTMRRCVRFAFVVGVTGVAILFIACDTGKETASISSPAAIAEATPSPEPSPSSATLAEVPAGSLLFFSTRPYPSDSYVVDVENGSLTQLSDWTQWEGDPNLSPDGKLTVSRSSQREDSQPDGIYVMSPDGSNEHLLASDARSGEYEGDPRTAQFIDWSARGKILYMQAAHQVWADYFISNADGSGNVRISQNSGCGPPMWSADGKNILLCQCTWSREGSLPCSISILNEKGRLVRTLAEGDSDTVRSVKWSPDESKVLFLDGAYGDAGRDLRALYSFPLGSGTSAQWSPDSSHIFLSASGQMLEISIDDGSSRTLAKGERFALSPNGLWVAVSRWWEIDVVSVADGSSRRVGGSAELGALSWSPNSDKIAFMTRTDTYDDNTLAVVNYDGTESKYLGFHLDAGIIWSRDGKRILYSKMDPERGGGVWWISPDGSARGRVSDVLDDNEPYLEPWRPIDLGSIVGSCRTGPDDYACLSPDGASEALVVPDSKALTIKDVASGVTREIKLDGLEVESDLPVWSNDGTRIALHVTDSNGYALYVVDVATGEAQHVADDARSGDYGESIAWSPDDEHIYYVKGTVCQYGCSPGRLYRAHPDGTGEEKVTDIRPEVVYGFKP